MKRLNKWMDYVYKLYRRYKKLIKIIDSRVNTKTMIKSIVFSLLISLLILLIPVLIAVNMFIFSKLELILSIFLLMLLTSWGFLYFYFYYRLLNSYEPELENIELKLPMLFEGTLVSLALFVLGLTVILVIF